MFNKLLQNARKPTGLGGKLMLSKMNKHHAGLAKWGFSHLSPAATASVLDIGCGGGANLAALLDLCPEGLVTGIDYSAVSVAASIKKNKLAVAHGHCRIVHGDVAALPFAENTFDLITAFETVYFWPSLEASFRQVLQVLKPGGVFMICNEADGTHAADEKFAEIIQGMTIYTSAQLQHLLTDAGFTNGCCDRNQAKHWLCLTAQKPEKS